MASREFTNAYYIKLGRGGMWEADSIAKGILRLGFSQVTCADVNARRWAAIEGQLRQHHAGKLGVATSDLNRLRDITLSGPSDVWVTFHQSKLWWTRLAPGKVHQDTTSKFRRTTGWSDKDIEDRLLVVNDLPGKITQLQGFRGMACAVRDVDLLRRVLTGKRSPLASQISSTRQALCGHLAIAIRELHWKDYETLVDLVFRDAGWQRVSVLGQHAKAYDLELREPITGDRYVVQVKSRANHADLGETIASFSADDYRRVFFVVHSPAADLASRQDVPEHVELVPPGKLADLALSAGLSKWIEDKAW